MTATLLDGQALADTVKQEVAAQVKGLNAIPGLGTILVGDDPANFSLTTTIFTSDYLNAVTFPDLHLKAPPEQEKLFSFVPLF